MHAGPSASCATSSATRSSTAKSNRFWRADPSRARQTGGTGLGLSISVEDARLHGGWLEAWGSPGAGAQFRLTLPLRAGDRLATSPLPLVPDEVLAADLGRPPVRLALT